MEMQTGTLCQISNPRLTLLLHVTQSLFEYIPVTLLHDQIHDTWSDLLRCCFYLHKFKLLNQSHKKVFRFFSSGEIIC